MTGASRAPEVEAFLAWVDEQSAREAAARGATLTAIGISNRRLKFLKDLARDEQARHDDALDRLFDEVKAIRDARR